MSDGNRNVFERALTTIALVRRFRTPELDKPACWRMPTPSLRSFGWQAIVNFRFKFRGTRTQAVLKPSLPANRSGEGATDDGLGEAIHLSTRKDGLLRRSAPRRDELQAGLQIRRRAAPDSSPRHAKL
jgi:hypothetical protein